MTERCKCSHSKKSHAPKGMNNNDYSGNCCACWQNEKGVRFCECKEYSPETKPITSKDVDGVVKAISFDGDKTQDTSDLCETCGHHISYHINKGGCVPNYCSCEKFKKKGAKK